jgi:DNA helicase-2/ATP-dependent DNA helicase PcrA
MKLICDLEVHSKYAHAVSKFMDVPTIAKWAKWKGIDVVGTGDFTHPTWRAELKAALVEDGSGLLRVKSDTSDLRFLLTAEVSSIFSQGGRGRRIHTILVAPSFVAADQISEQLGRRANLLSDGRPIIGLSCKEVLSIVLEAGGFIIPAHVWTPWFGLFGSKSGFNSLAECYEDLTPHVKAIETGLSSDIPMNWRLSANDNLALVSFSDAHSAPNLSREATVIQVTSRTYKEIATALQNPRQAKGIEPAIVETLEFFPEEGKYHYDGIASSQLSLHPNERRKLEQSNPNLARKVTVGVLSRIEELADRPEGYRANDRPGYRSVMPLQEIIASTLGVSKQSKKVQAEYERLVVQANELVILLDQSESELRQLMSPALVDAIVAVRRGDVAVTPGYDGIYGIVEIRKKQ